MVDCGGLPLWSIVIYGYFSYTLFFAFLLVSIVMHGLVAFHNRTNASEMTSPSWVAQRWLGEPRLPMHDFLITNYTLHMAIYAFIWRFEFVDQRDA